MEFVAFQLNNSPSLSHTEVMQSYAPPPPTAPLPVGNHVAVINPQFCGPYPVDLVATRKLLTLSKGNFAVTDVNGNIMFKVKGKFFILRDRRVLVDAAEHPIVTLQQKIWTARWQVYRGESTEDKDLLFSVKKSHPLQFRTELDVHLAGDTNENACDFRVKGSWLERSCTVYLGNTSTIIARMHRKHIVLGKDTFAVTVYPNVDYAFITALVVVFVEINEYRANG